MITSEGIPVQEAYVVLYPGGVSTRTDSSGYYSLAGLSAGEYSLSVDASQGQYLPFTQDNVVISETVLDVTLDISLMPRPTGNASVSGVVLDADTGLPLSGTSVYVWSESGVSKYTNVEGDGSFTLGGLPGGETYHFSAFMPGYGDFRQSITIAVDEAAVLNVTMVLANSAISGTIVDRRNGNPIAGLLVTLTLPNNSFQFGTYTDETGNFSFADLVPGTYTVSFGGESYPTYENGVRTTWKEKSKTVTVVANQTVSINLRAIVRPTGNILGYVMGSGFSLQNICTTVFKAGTSTVIARGEPSGEGGTFKITNLKPGNYTLRFHDCDPDRSPRFAKEWWMDSKRRTAAVITIVAGQDVNVDRVDMAPKLNRALAS